MLILIAGLPGSGKTTLARALAAQIGALHLNSDLVRRELGLLGQYRAEDKNRVYDTLLQRARTALSAKQDVVVDSTFYKESIRVPFRLLAAECRASLHWVEVRAQETTIRERLKNPRPDSEADFGVYEKIRNASEPIEEPHPVYFSDEMPLSEIVESIKYILMSTPTSILLKEIAILTQNLEVNYPALYLHLNEEKPAFDPQNEGRLSVQDLRIYYGFLKGRLKNSLHPST